MHPSTTTPGDYADPRGRGFRSRSTVEEFWNLIDARILIVSTEHVPLADAAGRVLASDAVAFHPVPPFDRAAMDGYALRGEETFGSDVYTPSAFRVIGRSRPGTRYEGRVGLGEAVAIATGAPMPAGADAVAPVETTRLEGASVHVTEAVAPGRHVGKLGEDIPAGIIVLQRGRLLRPQDLGVLSALGHAAVHVVRPPRVTLIVTGDELLTPGSPARDDRIADMNSVMIVALTRRDGGTIEVVGPLRDDPATLRSALATACQSSDCVLVSGGSSTGPEDHAPRLIAELGELPIHGIALRPASPAGIGFVDRVPVFLLPGNPVSCLCTYDLFAGRAVRLLGGRPCCLPYRTLVAALAHKLSSALGRVDYARVQVREGQVVPLAIGGASILSSTTRADGFVLVPADLEGYAAGVPVTVWLYDH